MATTYNDATVTYSDTTKTYNGAQVAAGSTDARSTPDTSLSDRSTPKVGNPS